MVAKGRAFVTRGGLRWLRIGAAIAGGHTGTGQRVGGGKKNRSMRTKFTNNYVYKVRVCTYIRAYRVRRSISRVEEIFEKKKKRKSYRSVCCRSTRSSRDYRIRERTYVLRVARGKERLIAATTIWGKRENGRSATANNEKERSARLRVANTAMARGRAEMDGWTDGCRMDEG